MDDREQVLSAGLRAFTRAIGRHDRDVQEVPNRADPHLLEIAFGSLVECTFWAATLDTQLNELLPSRWKAMRDDHEWGDDVLAMLWARDRHYHQFPFSAEPDTDPFFTQTPNAVIHIGHGVVWRSAEELELLGSRSAPQWRAAYVARAAGESTTLPLAHAASLFDELMPRAFELLGG